MPVSDTPYWLQATSDNSLPLIHFVHGNSFPTGTYKVFLDQLQSNYQIRALEMHGHNPAYPVTDCWPELCKELIASLEVSHARHNKPIILLGHSLGGMLSLMVAKMRPELVRCVVMLDSPVVAGWRAKVLHVAKSLNVAVKFPPAKFSLKRREIWPSKEAAFQHFASKDMFAIWPEQVLCDYISFGTELHSEGVTLRFKRDVETAIYCSLPHAINRFCAQPYPVPIGFICGTTSQECSQAGLFHTKKLVGENFDWIEGGHLYPLESPELAAEKAHAMVQKLLAKTK
ncbi:alpha/beta fold hydrolase [Solimicrobium silvestre]|uniref:Alpha/beta hydrolase family n=1 Tax=Solimicrobium silvestre TaxID=2099400 RepID=A0A2S9GZK6_9BURK|nr:alpha/beta hydrolase [Solimicrobium silvestre]PRC93138.1 Alpha/beta hydrolase family [Solimicrobium silvestre]